MTPTDSAVELAGFPWPDPTPAQRRVGQMGGSAAASIAMRWPGLTLEERCLAIYLADGWATPGKVPTTLLDTLGITLEAFLDLMWALLRKGYLNAVASRWS